MLRSNVVIAAFTIVLAAFTGLQYCSFIESERASLYLKDISFIDDDAPSEKPGGIDFRITIRNTGKHVADILNMSVVPDFGITRKALPEYPEYYNPLALIAPPIPPDFEDRITAEIKEPVVPQHMDRRSLIAGILDGSIPLWIYGLVEYNIGFISWRTGKLGFCMKFLPVNERRGQDATFRTCDNKKYTYLQ
jgi:hypothetical protein